MSDDAEKGGQSTDVDLTLNQRKMIEEHLQGRDIHSTLVLNAMQRVQRHTFIPHQMTPDAYADFPLPIGHGQTISQPYIVALMTQLALGEFAPSPKRVLDIGTGSGYQAAVLSEVAKEVYSMEIIPTLADSARERLKKLGYKNITIRCGDGHQGWEENAPFDCIIVAAAPNEVPAALKDQLAPGGRLVIPVGQHYQELLRITHTETGQFATEMITPVRFVPMTGKPLEK